MIYFTSDTHFGHKRMLDFRPWDTKEEMNEVLIQYWNDTIKDKDEVYHLGDFSFADWDTTAKIIKRLKGHKHLILGNHDHQYEERYRQMFVSVQNYKELKYQKQSFILFHYPIHKWNRGHYGSIHLHGHSHGNLKQEPIKRFDVGVDTILAEYKPIHIDTVIRAAEHMPLAEYHHATTN